MFPDFDMPILYALERLRTPFFDEVMGAVTHLGAETVFLVIAIVVYWCVSKKYGYYLLCTNFFGLLINQFAKIICRVPRPWIGHPDFTIVESARVGAEGYSFPSGHTEGVTATFGSIARFTQRHWLRAVCIAVIALVAFSRLYLGVHYPSDVLFSLAVGGVLVFALFPVFAKSDEDPTPVYVTVGALTLVSAALLGFVRLYPFPADADAENLESAAKNAWTLIGSGLGMLLSLFIDTHYVNFDTKAVWWAQILKAALGLGIVLGLRVGLKPVLNALFGEALFTSAIRYFCMVVFVGCVWPLTFRFFGRFGKKQ